MSEEKYLQRLEAWTQERLARLADPDMRAMANDESTPPCIGCAAKHVGVFSPAFLMLRGNFVFLEEQQVEAFVFDPNLQIEFFQMPSGAKACVVAVNTRNMSSAVIHDKCALDLLKKIAILERYHMLREDDDEVEEDPLGRRIEYENQRRMTRIRTE